MTNSISNADCPQCGHEYGVYDFECRDCVDSRENETYFDCRRCGFKELSIPIRENRWPVGRRHDTFPGYGYARIQLTGSEDHKNRRPTSATEVEALAEEVRSGIQTGEMNGNCSYVTRWNEETRCVEIIAGTWCE